MLLIDLLALGALLLVGVVLLAVFGVLLLLLAQAILVAAVIGGVVWLLVTLIAPTSASDVGWWAAALALLPAMFWLGRRRPARETARAPRGDAMMSPARASVPSTRPRTPAVSIRRPPGEDRALARSWTRLLRIAPGETTALQQARERCAAALRLAERRPLDLALQSFAALVRSTVPALADKAEAHLAEASLTERARVAAELARSAGQLAAEADRLHTLSQTESRAALDAEQAHIDRRTADDPFRG